MPAGYASDDTQESSSVEVLQKLLAILGDSQLQFIVTTEDDGNKVRFTLSSGEESFIGLYISDTSILTILLDGISVNTSTEVEGPWLIDYAPKTVEGGLEIARAFVTHLYTFIKDT